MIFKLGSPLAGQQFLHQKEARGSEMYPEYINPIIRNWLCSMSILAEFFLATEARDASKESGPTDTDYRIRMETTTRVSWRAMRYTENSG